MTLAELHTYANTAMPQPVVHDWAMERAARMRPHRFYIAAFLGLEAAIAETRTRFEAEASERFPGVAGAGVLALAYVWAPPKKGETLAHGLTIEEALLASGLPESLATPKAPLPAEEPTPR